jgi:hypothetical protein
LGPFSNQKMNRLVLAVYTKAIATRCPRGLRLMLTGWGLVGAGLATALAQGAAQTGQLTPDQQAIVDKIA